MAPTKYGASSILNTFLPERLPMSFGHAEPHALAAPSGERVFSLLTR